MVPSNRPIIFVLLLLVLDFQLGLSAPAINNENTVIHSEGSTNIEKCDADLLRRRERLDSFNMTFSDPRQLRIFKYLSARSFGQAVPSSALRSNLLDFPYFNDILWEIPQEVEMDNAIIENCYHHDDGHYGRHYEDTQKKDCESTSLVMRTEYRERFQKLRDLHTDCWQSGGFRYFLNKNATILPARPMNSTDSFSACDKIFNSERSHRIPSVEISVNSSKILDCDYHKWLELGRYALICKRLPDIPYDPMEETDPTYQLGDEIDALFSLPSKKLGLFNTFRLRHSKTYFRTGDYDAIFQRFANQFPFNVTELPFFGMAMAGTEVFYSTVSKLIFNETGEVKSRGFQLMNRFNAEMMNVDCLKSELASHYTKIPYVFDFKSKNITLLQLAKVAGSNWGFKYVHFGQKGTYEVNINNDKIAGRFIADRRLPNNPTLQRLKRFINSLMNFYWEIMTSRGIQPQPPAEDDYAVACTYEPRSKFVKFDQSYHGPIRRSMYKQAEVDVEMGFSRRFTNLSRIVVSLREPKVKANPVFLTSDFHSKLVQVAYDTFKDANQEIRTKASEALDDLLKELLVLKNKPAPIVYPEVLLKTDLAVQCQKRSDCQFLTLLQMLGSALDLTYLNELGDEVICDSLMAEQEVSSMLRPPCSADGKAVEGLLPCQRYAKGVFTYVPREGDEPADIADIRGILNFLVDQVSAAGKNK